MKKRILQQSEAELQSEANLQKSRAEQAQDYGEARVGEARIYGEANLLEPPVIVHTHADCDSVRIFNAGLAVQFHAGSGDGRYEVHIYPEREEIEELKGWQFVDSFEVSSPAWLAGHDCESHSPVYEFGPGTWFMSHHRDERLVMIERISASLAKRYSLGWRPATRSEG